MKEVKNLKYWLHRVLLIHRYYKISKFYTFLKEIVLKGGVFFIAFIVLLVVLEYFFLDFNKILYYLINHFSHYLVILIFFLSEMTISLFPPELFIFWTAKMNHPWLMLFLISTTSYFGGITAYFIGKRLSKIEKIKRYYEENATQHIKNLRKWGGLFTIIGALLPPPFSLISLAAGLIHYNFKHYLLWAMFRYVRFILYALIIFKIF